MESEDEQQGEFSAAPQAPAPLHAEPQEGGSYTRNLATGAITKAGPAPVAQPDQE